MSALAGVMLLVLAGCGGQRGGDGGEAAQEPTTCTVDADARLSAQGISLDTARQTDPVKLHPGAQKALDELGAPN